MSRNHWLWVVRPEFYAEPDGSDLDLGPNYPYRGPDSWWTCHRDTQPGDLVLLYRTAPKSDIAFLFEANSEARPVPQPPLVEFSELLRLLSKAEQESSEVAAENRVWDLRSRRVNAYWMQLDAGERQAGDFRNLWGSDEPIDDPESEWERVDAARVRLASLPPDTVIYDKEYVDETGAIVDPNYQWATRFSGFDVCSWNPLWALDHPLTLREMRDDPYLAEWGAIRASFQGSVFKIPESVWSRLVERLDVANHGFGDFIAAQSQTPAGPKGRDERELESLLERDVSVIAEGLRLFEDAARRSGRQYWANSIGRRGGYIDLLCLDQADDFVVVELKAERVDEKAVSQTGMYIGWVREHLAGPDRQVRGIVVAPGHDDRFRYALQSRDDIDYVDARPLAQALGLDW